MKDQHPLKCIWRNGSTNKFTGKSEMPELCKMRKCKGEFRNWKEIKEFKCKLFREEVNHVV